MSKMTFEEFMESEFEEPEWDEGWNRGDMYQVWYTQQCKIDKLRKYIQDNDICICNSHEGYVCEKCEVLDD